MTTFTEEPKYPDNIEVTDGTEPVEIVNCFMSIFNSKSVVVQLNHKYRGN